MSVDGAAHLPTKTCPLEPRRDGYVRSCGFRLTRRYVAATGSTYEVPIKSVLASASADSPEILLIGPLPVDCIDLHQEQPRVAKAILAGFGLYI